MKILFVYPRFSRHAESNPELLSYVPMNEYLGSPSLGIASIAAHTPEGWEIELRDDRLTPADRDTDADLVALSFFTPAATRALELCAWFKDAGKTVVAGGIFPTMMPDVVAPFVDALVVGEGEAVWPRLLEDFTRGKLEKVYASKVPLELEGLRCPKTELYFSQESERFCPDDYPVQISRGCPLSCHACVLPDTMTKRLRTFELAHVLEQLEVLGRAGKRACLTEDTSWLPGRGRRLLEALLDHLIERGDRALISYIGTSMPMILASPKSLLDKAKRAGVDMFYLVGGFDPITMNAFNGEDAGALARARDAIAKAHDAGIEPYTSFLIGNDGDDERTVDRMLEFAREAKILKAEFAIFTPYPGTPSWHRLVHEGRILTREWGRYNDANVVFRPARMSPDALHACYLRLWRDFYADREDLLGLDTATRTIQF